MSTALTDAMDQALEAYQAGDYRTAADSSSQIADQFPHYLAAHRLLGLASLKQGRTAEAERALSRVLGQDPCDPDAYLGLSMIHEERGVLEHALAYSQVAWELAPTLDDYREAIERIASMRYGSNGHLQLTHAALANLHIHNQRLRRAVREFETALLELPDRIDLRLGLATILWRLGEDDDAAALSRDLLNDLPDLARALVILADIEHREGNDDQANQYLERLRRVDQDGRLVASMVENNDRADAGFLLLPADAVPEVEIKTDRVVAERPTIAPAPDFTFQEEEVQAEPDLEDLQPIDAGEFADEPEIDQAAEAETEQPDASSETAEEIDAVAEERAESLVAELERMDAQSATDQEVPEQTAPETTAPAQPDDDSDMAELEAALSEEPAAGAGYEDLAAQFDDTDEAGISDLDDSDMADLLAEFEGIEPMSAEDFGASEDELSERSAGMFQDAEIDFDIRIEDEDAVQIGGGAPPAGVPGAFQAPAASPEDQERLEPEEFPEFPDVEEDAGEDAISADADREEATEEPPPPPAPQPQVQSGTGYTRLLGELGEEGLAPFDPVRTSDTEAREQPAGDGDADDPLSRLTEGWDEADDDIASAIPTGGASTDELKGLEDLGVEPFDIEEEDQVESEAPARPQEQIAQPEPETAPAEQADDSDFGDLEPFSFEDFEDADQGDEQGFNFGRLPWEQAEGNSALPSDEALEAMLASEIEEERAAQLEQEPEPELEAEPAEEPEREPEPELEPAAEEGPTTFDEMAGSFDELDASMAVTREFGQSQEIDPELEADLSEMEAAAGEHLDQHREPVEPYEDDEFFGAPTAPFRADQAPEDVPEESSTQEDTFPQTDADRLVQDDGIFERSRSAKSEMVSEGLIRGDRELVEEEPAPVEEDVDTGFEPDTTEAEDQFTVQTGATGDINTLRASIQADPQDPELHWWLGEALRKAGHIHEAIDEYRWLIKESPGRYHDVIGALNACAEYGEEEELAHRLIADVYRRLGDNSQARNHAALALAARRRNR